MKKKSIIIGIIVVIAVALGIWLLLRPKALGNMNFACSEPETSASNISFSGEAGDRIKFSFASNIENGDLDIILYDLKGNVVKELDRAKRLETYLTLDHSDIYTLEAEYKDFIGSFQITIYKKEMK